MLLGVAVCLLAVWVPLPSRVRLPWLPTLLGVLAVCFDMEGGEVEAMLPRGGVAGSMVAGLAASARGAFTPRAKAFMLEPLLAGGTSAGLAPGVWGPVPGCLGRRVAPRSRRAVGMAAL